MSVSTRVLGALLLCTCLSAQTRLGISSADWGTTVRGDKVAIYTLAGAGGLDMRTLESELRRETGVVSEGAR